MTKRSFFNRYGCAKETFSTNSQVRKCSKGETSEKGQSNKKRRRCEIKCLLREFSESIVARFSVFCLTGKKLLTHFCCCLKGASFFAFSVHKKNTTSLFSRALRIKWHRSSTCLPCPLLGILQHGQDCSPPCSWDVTLKIHGFILFFLAIDQILRFGGLTM